jgi:hypothetical protein
VYQPFGLATGGRLLKGGDLAGDGQYLVEVNESEAQVSDEAGVCKRLVQIATMEMAEVLVLLDHGPRQRNWLQRLLRVSDRIVEPCFWLGKAGEVAALTFLDGAWSEYRATDPAYPVEATLEQRQALWCEESTPAPPEVCLQVSRALQAAIEYLRSGERPSWLAYIHVR